MKTENNRKELRAFLETFIIDVDFSDDDDIFELGLVSSLMAMQLVLFVEKALARKLSSEDLDFANFRSIEKMDALMIRRAK